jgi:hypothetical protein
MVKLTDRLGPLGNASSKPGSGRAGNINNNSMRKPRGSK